MNRHVSRPLRRAAVAAAVLVALTASAPAAAARSFLWKASKGTNAVYLLGSVHMLTSDFYPLNPALESAYKDANLLVEEVDLAEMLSPEAQLQMLSRGMLPASDTLDKVVSPSAYAAISRHVLALGLPIEPLKRFKPWMLALTVAAFEWQKAGFDADLGLDKHFYDRAQADGKRVQGLETAEYQISRFDEMTMAQQEHLLVQTLKELETEQANIATLARAWKDGEVDVIEKVVLQDVRSDPVMYQRLLVDRNRNWLPKIEALFPRPGRALVVVGAAHLVGPDGLLAALRSKGYLVEQQ